MIVRVLVNVVFLPIKGGVPLSCFRKRECQITLLFYAEVVDGSSVIAQVPFAGGHRLVILVNTCRSVSPPRLDQR